MSLKELLRPITPKFLLELNRRYSVDNMRKFEFTAGADVKRDIIEKYQYEGPLLDMFATNKDFVVHKWHHYIPLYDRYFAPYKGREIRFLEIGVSKGGSLQMWRRFFGEKAIIFGIDINPDCVRFNGLAGQVRIGSQTDRAFLEGVVKEMGGIDIVLDDGSHHMDHIPTSLEVLFPLLAHGGIYMIEDLHSSYWKSFGGGYHAEGNFFRMVSRLVDDMHHWYHRKGLKHRAISEDCSGIHVHDSIVVLDKNKVFPPVHSQNG